MRRGLIARSPVELPDAVFDARLGRVRAAMQVAQLDALAIYTNNTRPAGASWLAGFVPYWSEAVLVVPRAAAAETWPNHPITMVVPFPPGGAADALARMLAAEGIPVVAGYPRLLHENPIFSRRGARYGRGTCPRSEALNREFLWFPFVNPPNGRVDMDDAVLAIEKIFTACGAA